MVEILMVVRWMMCYGGQVRVTDVMSINSPLH